MRERRSDALPSGTLRAFRGSGRQAKEAKLRDRAVSAETAMSATGDPSVARPAGCWTEGRVSGTRRAWPQGRRLFLREKHRPREGRNSRSREMLPGLGGRSSSEAPAPGRRLGVRAKGSTDFPSGKPSSRRGSKTRSRVALPGPGAQASSEAGRTSQRPGSASETGRPERQRPAKGAGPPAARHRLARDVALLKRSNARHAFGARARLGSRGVRRCPARTPNAGFPSQRPDALFLPSVFYHLATGDTTRLCGTLCSAPIYSSHPRRFMSTV